MRCPTCESITPSLHPVIEGKVCACSDPWHSDSQEEQCVIVSYGVNDMDLTTGVQATKHYLPLLP